MEPAAKPLPSKRHVLTVALEDYFQVGAFNRIIQRGQWYRFETRLEQNTARTLALLARHDLRATFFVLGWIGERYPELIRKVADAGHEIASKGFHHRGIRQMSPGEFRDDLLRTREVLENAGGRKVVGYRVAHEWFGPEDLWALDVLAETGFKYDSSIAPLGRQFAHERWRRFAHRHDCKSGAIWELPISCGQLMGWQAPIAGGNYFRQVPPMLIRSAVASWHRKFAAPLVLYFHTWELDPEQPKINSASWLTHLRHYRNLDRMERRLEYFFERYAFTTAAEHLGLDLPQIEQKEGPPLVESALIATGRARPASSRTPITVVVPCFNEELILPYLANTLRSVEATLSQNYAPTFLLVDDGSSDKTWESMQRTFGAWPSCELVRHEKNRGVAAAILTGIHRAETEIVCSIDCDCTYDPHELTRMIPLLADDVDLVTASPYHPQGAVANVPGWRLFLSRGGSWLYRRALRQQLATYTSCFRVYRRSAVERIEVHEPGFLGVAEILGRLDIAGSRIVEFPALLEARMLGRSKMKVVRTIFGHLRLVARLAAARMRNSQPAAHSRIADAPAPALVTASRGER